MTDSILLQTLKEGFKLTGTSVVTCQLVSNLNVGYMVGGSRMLTASECTEDLLSVIELAHDLIVT